MSSPAVIKQDSKSFKALGMLRWEDGKDHELPQDFADMLGWKELAKKVDSAYHSITEKGYILVLCDNYDEAGAINYYSKIKGMEAISFNADYINWFPLDKKIIHVIQVQEKDEPENPEDLARFKTITKFSEITDPFARESGTKIYVMKNATVDINKLLEQRLQERAAQTAGK